MRTKKIAAVGLAVAAALALTACGSSSASSGGAGSGAGKIDHGAVLRYDYAGVQTLDPGLNTGSTAMISNTWPVYDRLLNISQSGTYLPMLATRWTFSKDGRSLTLQLRKGVKFSDGTPFDAAAVKANLERYKSMPAVAASVAVIASVQVASPNEVVLHLTGPSTSVLTSISSATGIMISPKALASKDLGTHPVGTGAWVLASFRPGQEVTYKLRPDRANIWDPQSGKVAGVQITMNMAQDASYAALLSNQIDVVTTNGPVDRLQSKISSGEVYLHPMTTATTSGGIYLRRDLKPFDDVLVRRAVNYAIDRSAIVKSLIPNTQPRVQPMASVINGFDSALEATYPYDPAKAKALLKQAGYPHGVDVGSWYVANFGVFPQVAQFVQAGLAKVGITVKLQTFDIRQLLTEYSKSRLTGMIDFMSYPGIEPGADLAWFLENPLMMPGGIPKALSAQIATIDDPTVSAQERAARASKVVKEATDQAYYAPIWQGVGSLAASSRVHDMGGLLNPIGGVDFAHAWISK